MTADLHAGPGLLELTAGQLTTAHIGRVLQIAVPPLSGLLVGVAQHVDSPTLPTGDLLEGATHLLLERPPTAGPDQPGSTTLPVWVVDAARVVVDLRVEVGVCALCAQQLLRTPDGDCWHPWHVPVPCPPEPALERRPPGFRSGRPGPAHWQPLPGAGS